MKAEAAQPLRIRSPAERYGRDGQKNAPITSIGSRRSLNEAARNGLARVTEMTGFPYDEILNTRPSPAQSRSAAFPVSSAAPSVADVDPAHHSRYMSRSFARSARERPSASRK